MNKIEHLKMIQAIINRMAGNSFLAKGWCVTIVSALIVLAINKPNKAIIMIALFPVIMFGILDSYFLYQERLFRRLYDFVRTTETETNFSMDTSAANVANHRKTTWLAAFFSKTLILFYTTMLIVILLIISQTMYN
jgi:hypothetical protein